MEALNRRASLKTIVAQQLPEFIRAEYPTFVAFVEAYYEFLDSKSVDLNQVRDIDETLVDFIKYFKAELAHNYPLSSSPETEKFLLKNIKDQYLSKGSEASYRLLFRLLYGKDVYMDYPGKRMLRVSDGRWQQDVSIFIRADIGDPNILVGQVIDIQTSKEVTLSQISSSGAVANRVTANVEKVVQFSDNIYELFLDRNFYGSIIPGDTVKYKSSFQGQILPCTAKIKIQERGLKFAPGQVFEVSSGEGTAFWFKVLKTNLEGGLVTIDIIKFGLNYSTDFSVTVLPTSAVSTRKAKVKTSSAAVTYSLTEGIIGTINILNPGAGYFNPPSIVVFGGEGDGCEATATVNELGQITSITVNDVGSGYVNPFVTIIPHASDTPTVLAEAEPVLGTSYEYNLGDKLNGFTEAGYLNYGDYWYSGSVDSQGTVFQGYSDGAYVGTVVRQFFVDAKDTISGNPALLNVTLDAIARYPGYYKTNDGFLDDSMYIQDSYYYQAFSYVIRIDKQLETYASVVRSMLHPSGMMLFGEYNVQNTIPLSVSLSTLVKSLGVNLYDFATPVDLYTIFSIGKDLSTTVGAVDRRTGEEPRNLESIFYRVSKKLGFNTSNDSGETDVLGEKQEATPLEQIMKIALVKKFGFGFANETDVEGEVQTVFATHVFANRDISKTIGYGRQYETDVVGEVQVATATDPIVNKYWSSTFPDIYAYPTDENVGGVYRFALSTTINKTDEPDLLLVSNEGYIIFDSYAQGGYALEEYHNGWASTFTN